MRDAFIIGFDHYPEHYPETLWEDDMRLMREAGGSVVRIAEYAWSRMEPREGEFQFEWLDRFFDLAQKHDINIVLGTPTDAPPPWVRHRYPDIVMVNEDGLRVGTGGRRYRCPTSPSFRELSDRIVEQMAQRYGDHPQLLGWQIDNEIGAHMCFCEHCRRACRDWLKQKYGTVEAMNDALGLVFWAHEFSDWDEVDLPRRGMKFVHPSAHLDVKRFFSHAWIDFMRRQADIIRRHSPGRFITHNLPHAGVKMDMFELASQLDFLSIDMYPQALRDARWEIARCSLACRSFQDRPHWVMELTTGSPVTQFYESPVPRTGHLRQWAHLNAAYGAQGVMFFCWRKRPAGYEMLSNGLLEHDSKPRRYYDEVQQLGKEFERLAELLPTYDAPKEVAIVWDFADRMNAEINPKILGVPWQPYFRAWLFAARRLGLNARIARPTDDLSPYRLVIASQQYTTSPKLAANFKRYVQRGGTLLATQRIGIFDVHGNPVREPMPGGMRDLFGMQIAEYEHCLKVNANRIRFVGAELPAMECKDWVFVLSLDGADALATYEREYYADQPAACVNSFGDGRAIYLGTMLDNDDTRRFLAYTANTAGLDTLPLDWDEDIEIVRLVSSDGKAIHAVFNHALEPRRVQLPAGGTDLITGQLMEQVELEPLAAHWVEVGRT